MIVRIIRTPPVDPEFGLEVGQVHMSHGVVPPSSRKGCWILGRGGEPVKLLTHEYEVVDPSDLEVPKGFYVVRGPDRVVVGLELVRGNPFRKTRLPQLLDLTLSEQIKLHSSWTDGDDQEKWGWDSKIRVSMSRDLVRQLDGDAEDDQEPGLNDTARKLSQVMGSDLAIPITIIKDATRSFLEVVILIIKEPDASATVPAA